MFLVHALTVMGADPADGQTMAAISRVDKELSKRESKLQLEILSLMPLLKSALSHVLLYLHFWGI